jgi:hypothetical protein
MVGRGVGARTSPCSEQVVPQVYRPESEHLLRYVAAVSALCAGLTVLMFLLRVRWQLPLPIDAMGVPVGRDFVNTWFYGRAFFQSDPGRFYDRPVYEAMVQTVLPQNTVSHLWSYPPPFLLLAVPFGLLTYLVALCTWTASGLALLALALRGQGPAWLTVAALTSPVVVFAILAGQVSLLSAALTLVVFTQLDRRPVLAGFLLALFLIKPQTLLLVPVLLVASRRWTVLLCAAVGVVALVGLSALVCGIETWREFIAIGLPAQAAEVRETVASLTWISPTVTTEATQAGFPPKMVALLQASSTAFAIVTVAFVGWRGRRRPQTPMYEGLVVLACSVLATPYLLLHDLASLSVITLVVVTREGLIKNRFVLLGVLFAPLLQIGLTTIHLHVIALLFVGFVVWLVRAGGHARPGPGERAETTAPA